MKFLPSETHLNFMGQRKISASFSAVLVLIGVVAFFAMDGLNYGIDFRGGSLVQIKFTKQQPLSEIRQVLVAGDLGPFELQTFGDEAQNEFLVALPNTGKGEMLAVDSPANRVRSVLAQAYPKMIVRRVESVGPRVGEELKLAAAEAILFSVFAILIYVWIRFQWRFSVGAVVALMHDILIVLFAFVLTQKEITLAVVAAILTVAGYSINDSIVIFDRIRENLRKFQKKDVIEIFDSSLNQTLSRTLLTSGTTLFVLFAIYLFGGDIINDFAFALLLGVIAGTYSSLYIAAPISYELLQRFPPRSR